MLPFRVKGGSKLNSGIGLSYLLSMRTRVGFAPPFSSHVYSPAGEPTPTTLNAARGRLIPFKSNSPTGSTLTALSTRALMRI